MSFLRRIAGWVDVDHVVFDLYWVAGEFGVLGDDSPACRPVELPEMGAAHQRCSSQLAFDKFGLLMWADRLSGDYLPAFEAGDENLLVADLERLHVAFPEIVECGDAFESQFVIISGLEEPVEVHLFDWDLKVQHEHAHHGISHYRWPGHIDVAVVEVREIGSCDDVVDEPGCAGPSGATLV